MWGGAERGGRLNSLVVCNFGGSFCMSGWALQVLQRLFSSPVTLILITGDSCAFLTHDGYNWCRARDCVCWKQLHTSIVPSAPLWVLFMVPEILFLSVNNKTINHIIITFIQVEMSFGYKFHTLVVFPGSGRVQPPQFRVFLVYLMPHSHSLAKFADIEAKVTGATLSHCSFTLV